MDDPSTCYTTVSHRPTHLKHQHISPRTECCNTSNATSGYTVECVTRGCHEGVLIASIGGFIDVIRRRHVSKNSTLVHDAYDQSSR